jgi:hypothetical protein
LIAPSSRGDRTLFDQRGQHFFDMRLTVLFDVNSQFIFSRLPAQRSYHGFPPLHFTIRLNLTNINAFLNREILENTFGVVVYSNPTSADGITSSAEINSRCHAVFIPEQFGFCTYFFFTKFSMSTNFDLRALSSLTLKYENACAYSTGKRQESFL